MPRFSHERHKPPAELQRPRELLVACAPLRSNINLSRIVRVASCSGIVRVICCGNAKVIGKIARDGADAIQIDVHRTLPPVLRELKQEGYRLVGLEQATGSVNLHQYSFQRRSVLVIGNERLGLTDDLLAIVDDVVEIPVWGLPFSYNVATAATMLPARVLPAVSRRLNCAGGLCCNSADDYSATAETRPGMVPSTGSGRVLS